MSDEIKGQRVRARTLSKAGYRIWATGKDVVHPTLYRRYDGPSRLLFILGCQRSGTTLLNDLFQRDPRSKVYGEVSELTGHDPVRQLRLNRWDEVRETLVRGSAPLSVVKPLVESQNADRLLSFFPDSRAVWMLRHYRAVAASFIAAWGPANSIRDVRDSVFADDDNWRAQHLSQTTKDLLATHYHQDMDGHDAAALFWYARNRLWLEAGLGEDDRLMLCKYADLVSDSHATLRAIYEFLEQPYPGDWVTFGVHGESLGTRPDIRLDPAIEALCAGLWSELQCH